LLHHLDQVDLGRTMEEVIESMRVRIIGLIWRLDIIKVV
jgi:hypothetical protein